MPWSTSTFGSELNDAVGITDTEQLDIPRWDLCYVCDIKNSPDKNKWYTREEVRRHIQETHQDWAFCKGCDNLIWKSEYDRGKGWCDLCVILCYDCMDEEKYGPPDLVDFSSSSTEPAVTEPELEDPGPPSNGDWLTPLLYTGTSDREHGLLQWIRKLLSW